MQTLSQIFRKAEFNSIYKHNYVTCSGTFKMQI